MIIYGDCRIKEYYYLTTARSIATLAAMEVSRFVFGACTGRGTQELGIRIDSCRERFFVKRWRCPAAGQSRLAPCVRAWTHEHAHARTHAHTHQQAGFRATIRGKLTGSGTPPGMRARKRARVCVLARSLACTRTRASNHAATQPRSHAATQPRDRACSRMFTEVAVSEVLPATVGCAGGATVPCTCPYTWSIHMSQACLFTHLSLCRVAVPARSMAAAMTVSLPPALPTRPAARRRWVAAVALSTVAALTARPQPVAPAMLAAD